MDAGVFFVVQVWRDAHGFHAAVRDVSREDVLQMVFSLRIEEAMAQLRRAYPISGPSLADYSVDEATDYPDLTGHSYAEIRQSLIEPIEEAYKLCLRIGLAIANYFGAHG